MTTFLFVTGHACPLLLQRHRREAESPQLSWQDCREQGNAQNLFTLPQGISQNPNKASPLTTHTHHGMVTAPQRKGLSRHLRESKASENSESTNNCFPLATVCLRYGNKLGLLKLLTTGQYRERRWGQRVCRPTSHLLCTGPAGLWGALSNTHRAASQQLYRLVLVCSGCS